MTETMHAIRRLLGIPSHFSATGSNPDRQVSRIRFVECTLGLPVRVALVLVVWFFFLGPGWVESPGADRAPFTEPGLSELLLGTFRGFFLAYICLNSSLAILLVGLKRGGQLETVAAIVCSLDIVFVSVIAMFTGGYESPAYWLSFCLILRNCLSIQRGLRQIILNLLVIVCFVLAGASNLAISRWEISLLDDVTRLALGNPIPAPPFERILLLVCPLLLAAACAYIAQLLLETIDRPRAQPLA